MSKQQASVDVLEGKKFFKLTKSALNKFIQWSTSRYNSYCGYGNKKENVDLVYKALVEGNYKGEKIFTIQCAQSVGENGSGRYWKTKTGGDTYTINCELMTIEAKYSKRIIQFNTQTKKQ